ncbi:MAG: hypothetical protein JKY51_00190 [Opitutaceae bacterium]|nr:hypothetical protein [Opitutaceae bacterium]
MSKSSPKLEWSIIRIGEDLNWWVKEISDIIHWDPDGLCVIDPRQMTHLVELVEPLREYGFDPEIMEAAFIPFGIDKEVGEGMVRIVRVNDSLIDSEEQLFALPNTVDEEHGPYADFIDHISKARIKLLNDTFEFEQSLTIDELEDEVREEQNNNFIEGNAVHLYNEIISILDYVPAGWEMDSDDEKDKALPSDEFEVAEDTEDTAKLKNDNSLRWEEDEEKEDLEEYGGGPPPDEV